MNKTGTSVYSASWFQEARFIVQFNLKSVLVHSGHFCTDGFGSIRSVGGRCQRKRHGVAGNAGKHCCVETRGLSTAAVNAAALEYSRGFLIVFVDSQIDFSADWDKMLMV